MPLLICPNCKTQAKKDESFCSKCGTKLESVSVVCRACGKELNNADRYCGKCGTAVFAPEKASVLSVIILILIWIVLLFVAYKIGYYLDVLDPYRNEGRAT